MISTLYMHRCFQLARLGIGKTRTNPLVGAVITHEDKIIGEGYHEAFGKSHAEIAALQSVKEHHRDLLKSSTMYVNLEPCSHYGKTPPCADEIVRVGIPRVVIGCTDPNPKVNGKGIKKLTEAGVEVILYKYPEEAMNFNQIFLKNMAQELPYVILKFACSQDHYIGELSKQISISNEWSRYLVHKIRHTVDAILIGTNTALTDNPMLTNRLYYGKHPVRIVLDRRGRIPGHYHLFNDGNPTWLFTSKQADLGPHTRVIPWIDDLTALLQWLLSHGIGSILVEGGAQTLQSFINASLWSEMWVTTSSKIMQKGIRAPHINGKMVSQFEFKNDTLSVYHPIKMTD